MTTSKLHILPLPHPLILLPSARLTLPVSKDLGESILALIEESEVLPVVAGVPITAPPTVTPVQPNPGLAEWGTAARVLRLVKPPARNPRQPYLLSLHGLTRVRITSPFTPNSGLDGSLTLHDIEYPPTETVPSREAVDKFKHSALRLLDRLARDSVQQSRKDAYNKIAAMLDDITHARAPWMADVLVGSINGEYNDKLGAYTLPSPQLTLVLTYNPYSQQSSPPPTPKPASNCVQSSSLSKPPSPKFQKK